MHCARLQQRTIEFTRNGGCRSSSELVSYSGDMIETRVAEKDLHKVRKLSDIKEKGHGTCAQREFVNLMEGE